MNEEQLLPAASASAAALDVSAAAVEVGPARPEEVEAIALLSAKAFSEYSQLLQREPEVIAGVIQPFIEARLARITVARLDGRVVGTVTTSSRGARGEGRVAMGAATRAAFQRAVRAVGLGRVLVTLFAPFGASWIAIRRPLRQDELYVSSLAVDPAWQGRGIARRLLQEAETQARREQCRALALYVAIDNERALRLYSRWGFREELRARALFRFLLDTPGYVAMRRPLPSAP